MTTTALRSGLFLCGVCDLLNRKGAGDVRCCCARCGATLHGRTPNSLPRTWAFLVAAAVLYVPANLLPVSAYRHALQPADRHHHERRRAPVGDRLLGPGDHRLHREHRGAARQAPLPLATSRGARKRRSTWHAAAARQPLPRDALHRALVDGGHLRGRDAGGAGAPRTHSPSIEPGPGAIAFGAVVVLTMLATHELRSAPHCGTRWTTAMAETPAHPAGRRGARGGGARARPALLPARLADPDPGAPGRRLDRRQGRVERGPTITIEFKTAEGIEANKTRIRHKAVDIGTVTHVKLSEGNKAVLVTAELDRDAGAQLPRRGHALLGGAPAHRRRPDLRARHAARRLVHRRGSGEVRRASGASSSGLETPPPITSDIPGRRFMLRADELGALDNNSPVYYRGVLAGRVISIEVPPDGKQVMVGVFVHSPYDKLVSTDTRFWNASGVDLTIDANGLKLQTTSLIPAAAGRHRLRGAAGVRRARRRPTRTRPSSSGSGRDDAMRPRETTIETFVIKFTQSVRGLAVGAPVDFRGINAGEVRAIYLEFDPKQVRFLQVVEVHLYPDRLRSRHRAGRAAPKRRRRSASSASSSAASARSCAAPTCSPGRCTWRSTSSRRRRRPQLDLKKTPPEIPSVPGGLGELQESITNIVTRLEKVPFDAIAQDLRKALASLDTTLKQADAMMAKLNTEVAPELRATLEQARKTLRSAEGALAERLAACRATCARR